MFHATRVVHDLHRSIFPREGQTGADGSFCGIEDREQREREREKRLESDGVPCAPNLKWLRKRGTILFGLGLVAGCRRYLLTTWYAYEFMHAQQTGYDAVTEIELSDGQVSCVFVKRGVG